MIKNEKTTKFTFKKVLINLAFLIILPNLSYGQTSTEFWFAAPALLAYRTPIMLSLSSIQYSTVTIDEPANPSFTPIIVNLTPNVLKTVFLSSFWSILQTSPPDSIVNFGLHITATNPITASYVNDNFYNADISVLKGDAALGTQFYTPFQTLHDVNPGYASAYSAACIVATKDSTAVTITPRINAYGGHPANVPYSVVLNRGQSYSVADMTDAASINLSGTHITSDKPIAVTVFDDLVEPCADLLASQIVPVNKLGTSYTVVKNGVPPTGATAYVVATQNNTVISVNDTLADTAMAGETYNVSITDSLTYITGSFPVYVLYQSGDGCNTGEALMAPLSPCSASKEAQFTRDVSTALFDVSIVVRNGGQSNFTLNGNSTLIPGSAFDTVPGTGGNLVGANISFSAAVIPSDSLISVINSTNPFVLNILNSSEGGLVVLELIQTSPQPIQ